MDGNNLSIESHNNKKTSINDKFNQFFQKEKDNIKIETFLNEGIYNEDDFTEDYESNNERLLYGEKGELGISSTNEVKNSYSLEIITSNNVPGGDFSIFRQNVRLEDTNKEETNEEIYFSDENKELNKKYLINKTNLKLLDDKKRFNLFIECAKELKVEKNIIDKFVNFSDSFRESRKLFLKDDIPFILFKLRRAMLSDPHKPSKEYYKNEVNFNILLNDESDTRSFVYSERDLQENILKEDLINNQVDSYTLFF
jgi:hypothetical protein